MRHTVLEDELESNESCSKNLETVRRESTKNKRVNLGKLIEDKLRKKEIFHSCELFHTDKLDVYQRFFSVIDKTSPLFYSLTWPTHVPKEKQLQSLKIAEVFPQNLLLHIAGNGLTCDDVEKTLNYLAELGISNVLALQGDLTEEGGDFSHAVHLVLFIRKKFGSQFCIGVAGYPEMHPNSTSKEQDLLHLKEKVDAGANFIITQLFYDASIFINFVNDCRKIGINVPIIPGLYPFLNFKTLLKMSHICKVNIPKEIMDKLEPIKDIDDEVRNFGIELTIKIINEVLESGTSCGYHIFSLNKSMSVLKIYEHINLIQELQCLK